MLKQIRFQSIFPFFLLTLSLYCCSNPAISFITWYLTVERILVGNFWKQVDIILFERGKKTRRGIQETSGDLSTSSLIIYLFVVCFCSSHAITRDSWVPLFMLPTSYDGPRALSSWISLQKWDPVAPCRALLCLLWSLTPLAPSMHSQTIYQLWSCNIAHLFTMIAMRSLARSESQWWVNSTLALSSEIKIRVLSTIKHLPL